MSLIGDRCWLSLEFSHQLNNQTSMLRNIFLASRATGQVSDVSKKQEWLNVQTLMAVCSARVIALFSWVRNSTCYEKRPAAREGTVNNFDLFPDFAFFLYLLLYFTYNNNQNNMWGHWNVWVLYHLSELQRLMFGCLGREWLWIGIQIWICLFFLLFFFFNNIWICFLIF